MRLLTLLSLVLWMGCNPIATQIDSTNSHFDLPGFSEKLVASHIKAKSKVVKSTQVNAIKEKNSVITDSIFWTIELSSLLNEDINKPSLTDAYSVQKGIPDKSSNLLKTIYTALPKTHTNITLLEIKYLGTEAEVRQINARFERKNLVYTTEQFVQVWVNRYGNQLLIDSISTQGFNKTILLDSMKYYSKVVVIR